MLNEGLKRCVDCDLYLKECEYWVLLHGKKSSNILKKEDHHNCDYFKPKQVNKEGGKVMKRGVKITNENIHKQIRNTYSYGTVYSPYESYLYNKGWIDCLEHIGSEVIISDCHALNLSLLDDYNKINK